MTEINETLLDDLIKRTQTSNPESFSTSDISKFVRAFTFPHSSTIRSKAYVLLSAICQTTRGSTNSLNDGKRTEKLMKLLGPSIIDYLTETNDTSLRIGICALHGLFQVDWEAAAAIISQEGVVETIMDGVDLSRSMQLFQDVAHLLGQASGHKRCREIIPAQAVKWLEAQAQQTTDSLLRAAAAVALVKYFRGIAADASEVSSSEKNTDADQETLLAHMMRGLVVDSDDRESLVDAVEGLAYLSTRPEIKENLSFDAAFLRKLFSLIPRQKNATSSNQVDFSMVYGILVIISNICAHRPRLTEEQVQLEKLKNMAQANKRSIDITEESSPWEKDEHVQVRIHRLIDAGALHVIGSALSISDSLAVRLQVGKALLNIVEDKDNRGKVLQSGGAKTLANIIQHAFSSLSSKDQQPDSIHLEAIQALAKLTITSSPIQVFGPNIGAVYDAIRPFSVLLQHQASTLLQKFEAMMALTNLSSYKPEVADRVAKADGLLSRVELLMLEDHVLIRRSAVELVCDLIAGSDDVFERYGGGAESPNAKSKLQILVALADVDDLGTALAASGALATLTCSPHSCKSLVLLQQERRRVLPVLTQLIDPSVLVYPNEDDIEDDRTTHENSGLVHRAVVCARNLWNNIDDVSLRKSLAQDAQSVGLVKALVRLLKGEGLAKEQMILTAAAEALKVMVQDGITV